MHPGPLLCHQSPSAPCSSPGAGCTRWQHPVGLPSPWWVPVKGFHGKPLWLSPGRWGKRHTCSLKPALNQTELGHLMALSDAVAFRPVFFGEQGLILVSGLTGRNPEWNCCLFRTSFEDRIAAELAQSTSGEEHRPCDPMDVAHAHCILALELQILESPFKAKFPLTAGAGKGGLFCC